MIKHAFQVLVSGLLLFASAAFAAGNSGEKKWIFRSAHDVQVLVLHPTEVKTQASWELELISEALGKLPFRVWTRRFASRKSAVQFVENFKKKNTYGYLAPQNLVPPRARTEASQASIWKVTEQWSLDWEVKYAEWIEKNVSEDFFLQHKLETDCADAAYALKWIFARMHGLPMANTLIGSGVLFTQDSMKAEWLNLPTAQTWHEDRRFLAALEYLLSYTYTHTLLKDSYPVEMTKENFLPGTHHLSVHSASGHTMVVARRDLSDQSIAPLTVFYSSMPRTLRKLYSSGYWENSQPKEGEGGFLRMRWPVFKNGNWNFLAVDAHPGYSREQFHPDFMGKQTNFAQAVLLRLNPNLNFKARVENGVQLLKLMLLDRVGIVTKGFEACQKSDCSPGTPGDDDWGTTSRDARALDLYKQIESMVETLKGLYEVRDLWKTSTQEKLVTLDGEGFSIRAVFEFWKLGSFSSDARVPVPQRWGLQVEPFKNHLKQQFSKLYDERLKRITEQGSSCAQDCEPLSANWLKWHTFDTDKPLFRISTASYRYCENVSHELCEKFKKSLTTETLTLAAQTQSLKNWMEQGLWFVSDPRAELSRRLGEHRGKYRWKFFEVDSDFTIRPSGHGYFHVKTSGENDQGYYREIVDLVRDEKIQPPAGMVWSEALASKDLAIAQYPSPAPSALPNDLSFSIRDFSSGKSTSVTPTFPGKFHFVHPRMVFYQSLDLSQLMLLDFTVDPPVILSSLPKSDVSVFSVPSWLEYVEHSREHSKENVIFKIHYYEDKKVQSISVQDFKNLFPYPVKAEGVGRILKNHALVGIVKCLNADCTSLEQLSTTLAADKRTGQVSVLTGEDYYLIPTRDPKTFLKFPKNGGNRFLITYDDDLNAVKTVVLGGGYFFEDDSDSTHVFGLFGADVPYYRYHQGSWKVFELLSDELKYKAQSHGYVFIETKHQTTRMRRFDSPEVVFESPKGNVTLSGVLGKTLNYVIATYGDERKYAEVYDLHDPKAPIITMPTKRIDGDGMVFSSTSSEERGLKLELDEKLHLWVDQY